MTQLSVENLCYGYARHTIGDGVSLQLRPGEVLVVLGPNGSGKTTLFRTLLGLLPLKSGSVKIDGTALQQWSAPRLARALAYVPQTHASHFPFYVRDIVLMGRTFHLGLFSTPGRHDRKIADDSLGNLRIAHLADSLFTEISSGERQLVLIARALASEATILVMDEPTANLDFGNQALILKEILRLKHDGTGVMFSTHDPDHAFLCADHVLLVRGGRILATGTASDVVTAKNLKMLYGTDVRVMDVPNASRPLRMCQPSLGRIVE